VNFLRPVPILLPLSWVYGCLAGVRNWLYDRGWLRAVRADVPVVSVGNLTAGGTGKTPFTGEIVSRLQKEGYRVAVVSRGYGRASRGPVVVADGRQVLAGSLEGGDEPVMLARSHPGTVVVVAERRAEAAAIAARTHGAQVIVMDDGFQHRALARDLDIVVVDGRRDLRREHLMPAGRRREWLSGLRRAGLLVVAKVPAAVDAAAAAQGLSPWYNGPVAGFTLCVAEPEGRPEGARWPSPVLAFSGIADHDGFLETAASQGIRICADVRFADHHVYTAADTRLLCARAHAGGAAAFLTTEKDLARLEAAPPLVVALRSAAPVIALSVRVRIVAGEGELARALRRLDGERNADRSDRSHD
jgi:tetraacyldisaccharide 4'-kinase